MKTVTDTEEYEKKFLENYLKTQTSKAIKELEEKLKNTTDSFKILEIKRKIKEIETALSRELNKLNGKETDKKEMAEIGEKTGTEQDFTCTDTLMHKEYRIPVAIWNYLFEYQRKGVIWMLDLFDNGKGGVLADEMGLGKTIQICTVIVSLYISQKAGSFLILCPATVIDHWIDQIKKLKQGPEIHTKINKKGLTVLSYETFRNLKISFTYDCVFLDEGHKIKNQESQITVAVKKIDSKCRFVVTGTPIQNNLAELWSIFDFVNPGLLGSYLTFQDEFEKRIKTGRTEKEKQISYQYSVMLRSIIEPFILRRTKNSIDHILPGKTDKVIFVTLTDEQARIYRSALESKSFTDLIRTGFKSKNGILSAITQLRKICNHPILYSQAPQRSQIAVEQLMNGTQSWESILEDSCKLKVVFDLLDQWYSEGNKVLLFFQTIQMLEIAHLAIKNLRSMFTTLKMTGDTPLGHRTEMISRFNSEKDCFIFLLTTRVGGLGLNLTGANRVIIYDPDWNPSTDNQAKERIYRFGQNSKVEIYRMVCRDTVEEKIYQKQIYKDCLSKKILSNPEHRFNQESFVDMFSFNTSFKKDVKIEADKNFTVKDDELVSVHEEDKRDFNILRDLNSKDFLTGRELIEFIKRRETTLSNRE